MAIAENDDVIYHAEQAQNHQTLDNIHRLVTLERSQKLDLLIHLINNLGEPLVVCGPEGIGKTTLLEVLQSQKQDHWQLCRVEGSEQLSFERLLDLLAQSLSVSGQDSLQDVLTQINRQQKTLVWIIDNAGLLVPGLISSLIQFARPYDCLRLVFVLTHDELHLKNSSDPDITECHLIEIPPLAKQHYMAFLQNLSAGQGAMISFNAINDGLIDNLYQKTHGIPGKILDELPRLSQYRPVSAVTWGATGLILAGLIIAGGVLYLSKPDSHPVAPLETDVSSALYKKQAVDIAVSAPVISGETANNTITETPIQAEKPLPPTSPATEQTPVNVTTDQPLVTERPTQPETKTEAVQAEIPTQTEPAALQPIALASSKATHEPSVADSNTAPTLEIPPAVTKPQPAVQIDKKPQVIPEQKKVVAAAKQAEPVKPAETPVKTEQNTQPPPQLRDNGLSWLKQRNPKHYTLQIMALSQKAGVRKLISSNPVLRKQAHYFPVQKNGKRHYVIVMGDYVSRNAAKKARQTLPKKLQKAWIRAFKILQQQVQG